MSPLIANTMYVIYNSKTDSFFCLNEKIPRELQGDYIWNSDADAPLMPIPGKNMEAYITNIERLHSVHMLDKHILLVPVVYDNTHKSSYNMGQTFDFENAIPITEVI